MAETQKSPEEMRRERSRLMYDQTHHVSEVSKLPEDTRYWGVYQASMTYDSGYGHNGQADMCTEQLLRIVWFETEEALEDWVLKKVEDRTSYKVFRVEPVKTEVKAVFSIKK